MIKKKSEPIHPAQRVSVGRVLNRITINNIKLKENTFLGLLDSEQNNRLLDLYEQNDKLLDLHRQNDKLSGLYNGLCFFRFFFL